MNKMVQNFGGERGVFWVDFDSQFSTGLDDYLILHLLACPMTLGVSHRNQKLCL